MTRVYIAAPYAARDRMPFYVAKLERLGVTVTSSWLREDLEINADTLGAAPGLTDAEVSGHAQTDLEDINDSDVLILFTASFLNISAKDNTSGGRHVETGYALAIGLHVIVVGEPENVFHRMTNGVVEVVPDAHGVEIALLQWEKRRLQDQLRDGDFLMPGFHRCACGGTFRDWDSFVGHTEQCADWQAWDEHLEEAEATS